ncbi:hypothetical protein Bpro_0305 [Polaromonas sp. JS666]|nr:hypothetical protein Bpro_0305 [Polaromonas sp. JS666]
MRPAWRARQPASTPLRLQPGRDIGDVLVKLVASAPIEALGGVGNYPALAAGLQKAVDRRGGARRHVELQAKLLERRQTRARLANRLNCCPATATMSGFEGGVRGVELPPKQPKNSPKVASNMDQSPIDRPVAQP